MLMPAFVLHAKPINNGDDMENQIDANIKRYCEVLSSIENLINDHRSKQARGIPELSNLSRLVPSISTFHTPLPLKEAFCLANAKHSIAARRFVPPSFNDIRRMLSTAQIIAIAPNLKLITFDGDMTLYGDGGDFEQDSALVTLLVRLLQFDLYVCVVTAAGYADNAERYEARLSGLLKGFQQAKLPKSTCERFFVLGGECNYLFQCQHDFRLKYIPPSVYQPEFVRSWNADHVKAALDVAQETLERCVSNMKLPCTILRKPMAIGIVPTPNTKIFREQLDECALAVQHVLNSYMQSPDNSKYLPFCAFNGGNDVWVDIGNKLIGVQMLQQHLNAEPHETLHVGDQFLSTGNDFATRRQCCTLWIINPEETQQVLDELVSLLEAKLVDRSLPVAQR